MLMMVEATIAMAAPRLHATMWRTGPPPLKQLGDWFGWDHRRMRALALGEGALGAFILARQRRR
jgi:hypothetical protein